MIYHPQEFLCAKIFRYCSIDYLIVEFDDEDGGRHSSRNVPQKRRADETRTALLQPDAPPRADLEEDSYERCLTQYLGQLIEQIYLCHCHQ